MAQPNVWLITGASSGLGTAIAISALRAGHRVIATARNVQKATEDQPDITSLGGEWLQLDVTSKDTQQIIEEAVQKAGRIDVAVNNAGYVVAGVLEDLTIEEIQEVMDANFYGPLRVMKGVIPTMRRQKSGCIVNVSSISGLSGPCGTMAYGATKFALEGVTESLPQDLADFGIRAVLVEPGLFRTKATTSGRLRELSEPYKETSLSQLWEQFRILNASADGIPGDPQKLGDLVVEFVDGTGRCSSLQSYTRLMLGKDCIQVAKDKAEKLVENVKAMESIAVTTDFDS